MKRIMLFLMLMLGTVSAVMAQGVDVPVTDYDAMIGTFAGFAAGVVTLDAERGKTAKITLTAKKQGGAG